MYLKQVVEYSIPDNGYTAWSRNYAKCHSQVEMKKTVGAILHATFNKADEKCNQIILHGDRQLHIIDKKQVFFVQKQFIAHLIFDHRKIFHGVHL